MLLSGGYWVAPCRDLPGSYRLSLMNTAADSIEISGQLNFEERRIIAAAVLEAEQKPKIVIEVGITWLGGGGKGALLHLLSILRTKRSRPLHGAFEGDRSTYDEMLKNIRTAAPETLHRFTPLFGFSQRIIPPWLAERGPDFKIDFAFLDGGNNPSEQIIEFGLIDPHMPVGGILMAHDAKLRKGKWLVPYLSGLDNWESQLHDISAEGLFLAKKVALRPSQNSLCSARWHLSER